MLKEAGGRPNVTATVYQGKGWTREAIEPNFLPPSSQRIPVPGRDGKVY